MRWQVLALLLLVGCKSTSGQVSADKRPADTKCSNPEKWSTWNERLQAAGARKSGEGPAEHQARVRRLEEEGQSLARAAGCTQVDDAWQVYFDSDLGNRAQAMSELVGSFETCKCIAGGYADSNGATQAAELKPRAKVATDFSALVQFCGQEFDRDEIEVECLDENVSDLTPLAGLTALEKLWLEGTQVAEVMPLRELTALTLLNMRGSKVSDLTPLQNLKALKVVDLSRSRTTDLSPLKGLPVLEWLNVADTEVADVTPLKSLTELHYLDLHRTKVTDLAPLRSLMSLEQLNLHYTEVTDLGPLERLTSLTRLRLNDTRVTDAEVKKLQAVLPSLEIIR